MQDVLETGVPTRRVTIDAAVLRSMRDELVRVDERMPDRPATSSPEGRRTMFRGIQR
jgi:hypothetical protein